MKTKNLFLLLILSFICIVLAIGIGSVFIHPVDVFKIITNYLFNINYTEMPIESHTVILTQIRLPRVALAFVVGAMLAISGSVMQSVLRNPLASSYTLGISSGSAVGASIAILFGFSFFGNLTLPFFGLTFGLGTVLLAVGIANRLDGSLSNTTIILIGMAFSMFANGMIAFIIAFDDTTAQQVTFWQMGSFALKDWSHPRILLPVLIIGLCIALYFSKEMDILTFGEEHAQVSGVNVVSIKWVLLLLSATLTGFAVSMSGVIGFVDLFTPHIARRVFGSNHRYSIPTAAIMGGVFMCLCDLIARNIVAPIELPIGAVTSTIGAPFFIYLYFKGRASK